MKVYKLKLFKYARLTIVDDIPDLFVCFIYLNLPIPRVVKNVYVISEFYNHETERLLLRPIQKPSIEKQLIKLEQILFAARKLNTYISYSCRITLAPEVLKFILKLRPFKSFTILFKLQNRIIIKLSVLLQ